MIKIVKGNLLDMAEDGQFDAIVHGCNCFHTMGSGIAKQIKNRYPQAYEVDILTVCGDKGKLGSYSMTTNNPTWDFESPSFYIINAYTQYKYGNGDDFDYLAFEEICLKIINNPYFLAMRFGFPWIGCGLGGADKGKVLDIMWKHLNCMDITIVQYE